MNGFDKWENGLCRASLIEAMELLILHAEAQSKAVRNGGSLVAFDVPAAIVNARHAIALARCEPKAEDTVYCPGYCERGEKHTGPCVVTA